MNPAHVMSTVEIDQEIHRLNIWLKNPPRVADPRLVISAKTYLEQLSEERARRLIMHGPHQGRIVPEPQVSS